MSSESEDLIDEVNDRFAYTHLRMGRPEEPTDDVEVKNVFDENELKAGMSHGVTGIASLKPPHKRV